MFWHIIWTQFNSHYRHKLEQKFTPTKLYLNAMNNSWISMKYFLLKHIPVIIYVYHLQIFQQCLKLIYKWIQFLRQHFLWMVLTDCTRRSKVSFCVQLEIVRSFGSSEFCTLSMKRYCSVRILFFSSSCQRWTWKVSALSKIKHFTVCITSFRFSKKMYNLITNCSRCENGFQFTFWVTFTFEQKALLGTVVFLLQPFSLITT